MKLPLPFLSTLKAHLMAILFAGVALSSFTAGWYITYKWYSIERLTRENAQYKKDQRRMADALQLSEKTDTETDDIEKANQEILDALLEAQNKPPMVVSRTTPGSCPAVPVRAPCVSADWLRKLGQLR